MDKDEKNTLTNNWTRIVQVLDAKDIMDDMRQAGICIRVDKERIDSMPERAERARYLLCILPTGGAKAFSAFIKALKVSGYAGNQELGILLEGELNRIRFAQHSKKDKGGDLPIHKASQNDDLELLREALQVVDVDVPGYNGRTPLHAAVETGSVECAQELLHHGAQVDKVGDGGRTPLHLAALQGKKDAVRLLLAAGANPDLMDTMWRWTPLDYAIKYGSVECAQVLLQHGAQVDKANVYGTPLHESVYWGRDDCVRLLLAAGANPDSMDDNRRTPLDYAIQHDRVECAQELLKHGAQVDKAKYDGETPLHIAVRGGREDVVRLLLAAGANPHLMDQDGDTPLDFAIEGGREGCATILRAAGARRGPRRGQ